jgi:hypothetical protein
VSHIRVWGSKVYRNLPRNEKTEKLADRAVVGHLIGYSTLPLGYLIWDITTGTPRVATDVVIDADIPDRAEAYFAEIDKKLSVESSRVNIEDFRWLKGTSHRDHETGLLYRTKSIEVRSFMHQTYLVGCGPLISLTGLQARLKKIVCMQVTCSG